jgi:hypothetical protein
MKVKEKPEINKLCEHCYNVCKQYNKAKLVSCPNYVYKPYQQSFDFWKEKPKKVRKKTGSEVLK